MFIGIDAPILCSWGHYLEPVITEDTYEFGCAPDEEVFSGIRSVDLNQINWPDQSHTISSKASMGFGCVLEFTMPYGIAMAAKRQKKSVRLHVEAAYVDRACSVMNHHDKVATFARCCLRI